MAQEDVNNAIAAITSARNNGTLTLEFIRQKAASLSATVDSGKNVYAFYSGSYLSNASARDAALSLAAQSPNVAVIDQTDVANFLSHPELDLSLDAVTGNNAATKNAILYEGNIWGHETHWPTDQSGQGTRSRIQVQGIRVMSPLRSGDTIPIAATTGPGR